MRKKSVAFTSSMVLLASGCGGGDAASTATSAISPARHAAACAAVLPAEKRYLKAAGEMGLAVQDKPLERRTRAAAEAFRRKLAVLQRASSNQAKREVDRLVVALSTQEKMFGAFDAHRLSEAAKYGNEVNDPLQRGLASLKKACPGA